MQALDKLRHLKAIRESQDYSYLLEVDSGINDRPLLRSKMPVRIIVVGSYLFNKQDRDQGDLGVRTCLENQDFHRPEHL